MSCRVLAQAAISEFPRSAKIRARSSQSEPGLFGRLGVEGGPGGSEGHPIHFEEDLSAEQHRDRNASEFVGCS